MIEPYNIIELTIQQIDQAKQLQRKGLYTDSVYCIICIISYRKSFFVINRNEFLTGKYSFEGTTNSCKHEPKPKIIGPIPTPKEVLLQQIDET